MLQAFIKNFSYQKVWFERLELCEFSDINTVKSKSLVKFDDKIFALSKWVSPKRTRSYPYARVYDTFAQNASKIATIIPIFKDEGADGEMDYLQWDSVSLMSLLNVYVILGFYEGAEKNPKLSGKITNQIFNNDFIKSQLNALKNYHQSALHWNLNQLSSENLSQILHLAKAAHERLERMLNVKLHERKNIDKFADKITQSREKFMEFSRTKAKNAQNAESLTTQPKEHIGIGEKVKITIENYLGGQYFFTIDDVFSRDNTLYLCESKHSKNAILPSADDIKDGLLKLMLYNNLAQIKGHENFKIVLRLSSDLLKSSVNLPCQNLADFTRENALNEAQITMLEALNLEAEKNHFEIWINNE